MPADEERYKQAHAFARKLGWLIAGRLATAIVLLSVGALLITDTAADKSWVKKLPVFLFVIFLTFAYSLIQRFSQGYVLHARLQFGVDVLIVTWLVWTSDVIHSPY